MIGFIAEMLPICAVYRFLRTISDETAGDDEEEDDEEEVRMLDDECGSKGWIPVVVPESLVGKSNRLSTA